MSEILRKPKRERRKLHIRKKLFGTKEVPRLSIFKSRRYIFAQLSDDDSGKCITGYNERQLTTKKEEKPVERAERMGTEFAKVLKGKKVEKIVFDRGGYKYHGRIKAFADSMRKAGIKF